MGSFAPDSWCFALRRTSGRAVNAGRHTSDQATERSRAIWVRSRRISAHQAIGNAIQIERLGQDVVLASFASATSRGASSRSIIGGLNASSGAAGLASIAHFSAGESPDTFLGPRERIGFDRALLNQGPTDVRAVSGLSPQPN